MTAEKFELFTKPDTVAVKSDKRLEELVVMQGARDRVEGLVRCIFSQSVEALHAFVIRAPTQLVDPFAA